MTMLYDEYGTPFNIGDETDVSAQSVSPSVLTVDYYRTKVQEFQRVMELLDVTGRDLEETGYYAYAANDETLMVEYHQLKNAFDSKRGQFLAAAQAIQLASQGINAMGVNFPSVQVPIGLAAVPLVPVAAIAAAVVAATALISWAMGFWNAVGEYIKRAQHLTAIGELPPEEKAAALATFQKLEASVETAKAETDKSPLNHLATLGKWAVIGGGLFLVYKFILQGNHNGKR